MKKLIAFLISTAVAANCLAAGPTFTVDASHPTGNVSPKFFGLMTEETNHSYDGGLYTELIQNRAFLDNSTRPTHWSVMEDGGIAPGAMSRPRRDRARRMNGKPGARAFTNLIRCSFRLHINHRTGLVGTNL